MPATRRRRCRRPVGARAREDLVLNGVDNCPAAANGPGGGTCTAGDSLLLGTECLINAACGTGGVCSIAQEDTDANTVGDACEPTLVPEPGSGTLLLTGLGALIAMARTRPRRDLTPDGSRR